MRLICVASVFTLLAPWASRGRMEITPMSTRSLPVRLDLNVTPLIDVRYGAIVQVIDAAKGAGVSRIGVITERMRSTGGIGRT